MNTPATTREPRYRMDTSLPGQLNTEWNELRHTATPDHWRAHPRLDRPTLGDIEARIRTATPSLANEILHALLDFHHSRGDYLAARTVLQLMLGKAIRLAHTHSGRDTPHNLETLAIEALWQTITTYPLARRPKKIAANITMDTLHTITKELTHTHYETPSSPHTYPQTATATLSGRSATSPHMPPDLELLNLLTWATENQTITAQDATLILDIYTPPPGQPGGKHAASIHGLTWPTARQRAHRAIRKITHTLYADTV